MAKVSVFHIGPQKSATTWQYHCFQEHPDIGIASSDAVHYFDLYYHRDPEWYHEQFDKDNINNKILVDMTPSYIRDPETPERIHSYNKDAKIILCLREPISRAFSHYWHIKKKALITYNFSDALKRYDLFSSWIRTGFYARHIENYLKYFNREQILIQNYDELQDNPDSFLEKTCDFIGADTNFKPTSLNQRINIARPQRLGFERKIIRTSRKWGIGLPIQTLRKLGIFPDGKMETLNDVPRDVIEQLLDIYEPETQRLEKLLDIDLSHWRTTYPR